MPNDELALRLTEIYYSKYNGYISSESIVELYKSILNKLNEEFVC